MSTLQDLLLEASARRASIDSPRELVTSQEALDRVVGYIEVEKRILAFPDAMDTLVREINTPPDSNRPRVDLSYIAGIVLARSAFPGAAAALLATARRHDEWCAHRACSNLSWLARTQAAADALRAEVEAGGALASPPLRMYVLVEALIHQRRRQDFELIEACIQGDMPEDSRARLLEEYVCQCPEPGLRLAQALGRDWQGPLSITALGLRAVYGDQEASDRLLQGCRREARTGVWWETALDWVGHIARPEAVPLLLDGLHHSDPWTRMKVVTSLAWYGTPEAWRAVTAAMEDPARDVFDQAMALVFDWLGDVATEFKQTWQYGVDGHLTPTSRARLTAIMLPSLAGLEEGRRYMRRAPLDAAALLDCLYRGRQPGLSWSHWVSMTGVYRPYAVLKDLLYNFLALGELSLWLQGVETPPRPEYYTHPAGTPDVVASIVSATAASTLQDLLSEAAQWRSRICNPSTPESSQEALDQVAHFIEVENQILALPDVTAALVHEMNRPVAIDSQPAMASLVLARSTYPGAAAALLATARGDDTWCTRIACMHLSWLARTQAAATALRNEVEAGGALASPSLPMYLVVNALIHQRRRQDCELIETCIQGDMPEDERTLLLEEYVCQCPEPGLRLAEALGRDCQGPLSVTALGLRAVYGDQEAGDRLLQGCRRDARSGTWWHTALRWVGRIARPETVPLLLDGFEHPDPATRVEVVTSLAWQGTPEAWRAVTAAMEDPAREVFDQAMALVFDWLGDLATEFAQTWQYGVDGRLTQESRAKLAALMLPSLEGLEEGRRYMCGEPLDAEALLDCLYRGLQPELSWYHWVSMTGVYRPYSVHKDLLYNFPALGELSLWLLGG